MDQARQTAWKDEVLGEILRAVSSHAPLRPVLTAVPWQDVDDALNTILGCFERLKVFPLSFPMDA